MHATWSAELCVCARTYICVSACVYMGAHVCVHICMYDVCVCLCKHTYVHAGTKQTCAIILISLCTAIMYIRMCVCINITSSTHHKTATADFRVHRMLATLYYVGMQVT